MASTSASVPAAIEQYLKNGSSIELTQSAIVLESLVNKFFAELRQQGRLGQQLAAVPG